MSECVKVLRDELPYNLHIFVNSVEFIAKVIDTLKLAPEAVKVVCSTSGESRQENQRKLGNAYPIGQPSDPAKKVNFYTSTCFEGCDIFDPDGVTFIVSDGRKAHTLLDISTLFTQICGRIRDSRYKAQIVHVYSTTKYSKAVTLDEFVAATQRTLADAESYAAEINSLSEATRVKTLSKIPYINEQYVRIVDNRLVVEKNLANMDIVNFKISRHIYATYVNLTDELQRNGYKVTVQTYSKVVEHLAANPTARTTFRELFDEYCRLKTMTEQFFVVESPAELCAVIEQRHPGSRRLTSLLILFFSLPTADALYSLGTTRSNTRHTFFPAPTMRKSWKERRISISISTRLIRERYWARRLLSRSTGSMWITSIMLNFFDASRSIRSMISWEYSGS